MTTSTFTTVDPQAWIDAYNLTDGDQATDLLTALDALAPIHRAMRGITDPQAWVNAYSQILHETTQRTASLTEVWTTDAADLRAHLAQVCA